MKYAFPFLLILLAASPSGAQAAPPPEPSSGDTRLLFSDQDYPPLAVKNKEQGTVQAELTVGPDGRVKACKILRSSNSISLDTATCNILVARAKFKPARDSNGNAVQNTFVTPPITWRLADESGPAATGVQELAPGYFRCGAPAGHFFNHEIPPLQPGKKVTVRVRPISENVDPTWEMQAAIYFETPSGRMRVQVGKADNDLQHIYVALLRDSTNTYDILGKFPVANDWIELTLKLDDNGKVRVSSQGHSGTLDLRTRSPVTTKIHCHSGVFEIVMSPPPPPTTPPPPPPK